MIRVPVSQRDKEKSYYKYFTAPMAQPAPGKLEGISAASYDLADVLSIHDRNKLFDPGTLPGEFGWWVLEDGTASIAHEIFMPEVTGEMFDWWFAWHPIDRLRYGLWNHDDHFDVYLEDKSRALNPALSLREKHWGSTHYVWEDIGMGSVDLLQINFARPKDLGYDESKIDTDACNALICANCISYGTADTPDLPVVMTHFLRPVDGGSSLRSRFWMGWQIINGEPVKCIPDGVSLPEIAPKSLLNHNIREFTQLASILSTLYAEEHNHW